MDASEGKPNGPRTPYQPVQFRRIDFQKDYVEYAAGATHAAAPGINGPIGVVLTSNGEVWTWGMVLGDPRSFQSRAGALVAKIASSFHLKVPSPDPLPCSAISRGNFGMSESGAPARLETLGYEPLFTGFNLGFVDPVKLEEFAAELLDQLIGFH
jgi:hypothetical protein